MWGKHTNCSRRKREALGNLHTPDMSLSEWAAQLTDTLSLIEYSHQTRLPAFIRGGTNA